MITQCIFRYKNVYFLSLMSEYIGKGDVTDDSNVWSEYLLDFFDVYQPVSRSNNLSQLLFYFLKLCQNCNVKLDQSTFKEALKKCKNEKCQDMLKQYIID